MSVALHLADCREILRTLPDCSVDAVITDPPYEIGFMGHGWDASRIAFDREVWTEVLRVLKPGGHVVAYGAARTYHWLACAVELAGFDIRDMVPWLQGQGMPHGTDISKAIDRRRDDTDDVRAVCRWLRERMEAARETTASLDSAFGFNGMAGHWTAAGPGGQPAVPKLDQWDRLREILGFGDEMDGEVLRLNLRKGEPGDAWSDRPVLQTIRDRWSGIGRGASPKALQARRESTTITAPATPEAQRWQGWNTQLAPGHEPCVLARKPCSEPTVAANVLRWGTGAINVDGCRLEGGKQVPASPSAAYRGSWPTVPNPSMASAGKDPNVGRWPPNVTLSEAAAVRLDALVGKRRSGARTGSAVNKDGRVTDAGRGTARHDHAAAWEGGPSEFFYTAKAATRERERGCEHLRWARDDTAGFVPWEPGLELLVDHRGQPIGNPHPTVKPLALLRWLVRLVTPPGGTVLDPFMGSGTTGVACVREGFGFIGCDLTPWAYTIAEARIRWAEGRGPDLVEATPVGGAPVQGSLFG